MARRLGTILIIAGVLAAMSLAPLSRIARADMEEMDAQGESNAKEALRLYKQGFYEDAAKIFARLSVDYPETLVFERNLGACFYYLRKADPALSNLRHYLSRKKNIADDDRAIVERWIGEMERLREQETAARLAPPQPATEPTIVLPEPVSSPAQIPVASPPPAQAAASPAALNVSTESGGHTEMPSEQKGHFYTNGWFWTGVLLVAGGAVSAYWLTTRRQTENACSGGTIPCDAIK